MDQGVLSVVQRFPSLKRAIEERALKSPDFRSLCLDFHDAQAAHTYWSRIATLAGEKRRREYETLVAELADEIEATLAPQALRPRAALPHDS
jgi:hypothetical protein